MNVVLYFLRNSVLDAVRTAVEFQTSGFDGGLYAGPIGFFAVRYLRRYNWRFALRHFLPRVSHRYLRELRFEMSVVEVTNLTSFYADVGGKSALAVLKIPPWRRARRLAEFAERK